MGKLQALELCLCLIMYRPINIPPCTQYFTPNCSCTNIPFVSPSRNNLDSLVLLIKPHMQTEPSVHLSYWEGVADCALLKPRSTTYVWWAHWGYYCTSETCDPDQSSKPAFVPHTLCTNEKLDPAAQTHQLIHNLFSFYSPLLLFDLTNMGPKMKCLPFIYKVTKKGLLVISHMKQFCTHSALFHSKSIGGKRVSQRSLRSVNIFCVCCSSTRTWSWSCSVEGSSWRGSAESNISARRRPAASWGSWCLPSVTCTM